MPGILPMKVIKVGNSSQSRIAQACDRCRSKKIRCDGVRPCCSQCANVGFECKTSDKLSRRAFPRGYTESLEDRVRSLEAEVRELKGLLDEKDEKIDVLSRIHSFSPASRKSSSPLSDSASVEDSKTTGRNDRDDLIQVQHSSSLLRNPTRNAPFTGPSSTRAFLDAFTNKLEDSGKSSSGFSTEALLSPPSLPIWRRQDAMPKTPPRLVSDQLINIFFQEWAPLYPVVHRPTILKLYGHYTTDPEMFRDDKYALALLNLIFGIAAISSTSRIPQDPTFFEQNWSPKLDALSHDISLQAVQCYVLAQIYYTIKADYKSLLRYRGLSVSMCHQLGLHQSQKRFSFNALTSETRKKVFWCQYVLDRFAAALTGLPVLLAESDIGAEYPADADDENVTETGFVPTLPGESTRISSALALFGAARILNKVLQELYPSPAGYEVSLSTIHSLAEELDDWLKSLAPHLRLEFSQDKPSTNVTGSRSPVLSIAYYFIRTLIRRPAVCFAQPNSASPSMLALVDSGKHMIQILQLLEERRMSLSLCINKRELIFLSGLALLWQNMDLGRDCKLVKEGQKSLSAAISLLECESTEATTEFSAIVNLLAPVEEPKRENVEHNQQLQDIPVPSPKARSPKKQLQSLKTRLSCSLRTNISEGKEASHRSATAHSSPGLSHRGGHSPSSLSVCSVNHELTTTTPRTSETRPSSDLPVEYLNLDYLPLGDDNKIETKPSPSSYGVSFAMSDWEHVLTDADSGPTNIFPGIYGGNECGENSGPFTTLNTSYHYQTQHSSSLPVPQAVHELHDWSPEAWSSTSSSELHHQSVATAQSVISYSEESLGSAEDLVSATAGTGKRPNTLTPLDPFEGIVIPHSLDAIDHGTDYPVVDGWATRCAV